jgi:hypothetical protein
MSYDRTKVDFTQEEHDNAAKLDVVVEAISDGLSIADIAVAGQAKDVLAFIAADGDRGLTVKRLMALALMLERDNEYLNEIG